MFDYLGFKTEKFKKINFNDVFFDSFKNDYSDFKSWILKKSNKNANVFYSNNAIKGFIYIEERDVKIKLCTLKLEKDCSFLFDSIMKDLINLGKEKNKNIYLTIFSHHKRLISRIEQTGFINVGHKNNEIIYEYFIKTQ